MFKKGEFVVYGSKGVCEIQDISPIDIPGAQKDRLYYIMRPVHNNRGTLYLPIDSDKSVIRPVMTEAQAIALMDEMEDIALLIVEEEKQREVCYKEALRSCNVRAWVSMIKALLVRKDERLAAGKKVTALDERYLKATQNELYGEMSVSLSIPRDQIEEHIRAYCEKRRKAII